MKQPEDRPRLNEWFVPEFGPLRFRAAVGLLFLPYTGMVLAFTLIGSMLAETIHWDRVAAILAIYFLALGIGAHALDALGSRGTKPWGTVFSTRQLWLLSAGSVGLAYAIGIHYIVRHAPLLSWIAIAEGFFLLAYNLEWFRGRFHTDGWFAVSWGGLPVLAGYVLQTNRLSLPALLIATAMALLGLVEIKASRPYKTLKRNAESESSSAMQRGHIQQFEAILKALSLGVILLGVGITDLALDQLRQANMDLSSGTSFGDYWKATRERLDAEFECWVPRFFKGQPADHVAAVREVLAGGKRLRACLVCLLSEALGGTPAAALPRAIAVECVQAASLIHDDLIDGDTLRRNRAATWTTKGARRAVLLGDLMFATALQRMAELGRDDALALGQAIATMAMGAYQEPLVPNDLDAAVDPASLYPRLIYLKTGVLFGTAARLGALAAGFSSPLATLAFEYGARTGEAYQIADDLQDWVELPAERSHRSVPLPLAPALWHFCSEVDVPSGAAILTTENAEQLRPRLRNGMLAAIESRLQQARAAADQLPVGRYQVLLRTAPRVIVQAMLAGAR